MRQRTFEFDETTSFGEVLSGICDAPDYRDASDRLLIVFEPNCDPVRCAPKIMQMTTALPSAHICGMTTLGAINDEVDMPSNTRCTLLTFERSNLCVNGYNCHDMEPEEAGEQFADVLDGLQDVRGVLIMSSCVTLWPEAFVEAVAKRHPSVPLFGAQAGTAQFDIDHSTIMVDGSFYDRGIMAIAFTGEDLHIQADYNMGFRPIGREFEITECADMGTVQTIDDLSAASLYDRYLGVADDDFFYENVCAFPLIEHKQGMPMPRVPIAVMPEEGLRFSTGIAEGATVSLSYSKPEYLLQETLASANGMAAFGPQAVLVFACMNRRIFMGNVRADRELDYYKWACETTCWGCGFGEILHTENGGGILNSALIAVGFREGDGPVTAPAPFADDELASERSTSIIPLADRLVTFLEAMTAELRNTIEGLSFLAQRDTLTGLFNRRYMDDLLEYELSRLGDDDKIVLLMFDIDHFKSINDTYGHDVGDQVLKELTKRVEHTIRANDVLSRWGGEEFLLLFTRAAPELAFMLADRIRYNVEKEEFDTVGRVTISVGVTLGTKDDTAETLFARVDAALYDAKKSGRNRVCQR